MNLAKILNTLLPDYQIVTTKPIKIEQCTNYLTTQFENENTFDIILKCIVYNLNLDFNTEKQNIISQLNKYTFNELINIKKVLLSIENNQVNNEVKIFLAGYYQINIYVYHVTSRIMKIFYLEDNLYNSRKSILLFYNHDLDPNIAFYQTTAEIKIFTYNDNYIQDMFKNIYTIVVGLIANKILTCSDNLDTVIFCTGEIEEITFINEENILFNNDIPKLTIHNVYDYRTFDVKAFNKRYDKEKFMSQLYSLKTI